MTSLKGVRGQYKKAAKPRPSHAWRPALEKRINQAKRSLAAALTRVWNAQRENRKIDAN